MSLFKITEFRVLRRSDGTASVYVDGLGTGASAQIPADPVRVALMLTVFDLQRDCYWETGNGGMFMTTPVDWNPDAGAKLKEGIVTGWDIRVPATSGVQPQIYLHLIDVKDTTPTSGDAAVGWATIQAPEKDISLMLALVESSFCYYSPASGMRNTGFTLDFQ